jgi:hypothetical protein
MVGVLHKPRSRVAGVKVLILVQFQKCKDSWQFEDKIRADQK